MEEYKLTKEFYPDGREGMIRLKKSYLFKLEDFVIDQLPESCYQCPCGFSTIPGNPCGRNVPWTAEDAMRRPSTCKLRSLDEFLASQAVFGLSALTLPELYARHGKPIWVVPLEADADWDPCWVIFNADTYVLVQSKSKEPRLYLLYATKDYGKTWAAYLQETEVKV